MSGTPSGIFPCCIQCIQQISFFSDNEYNLRSISGFSNRTFVVREFMRNNLVITSRGQSLFVVLVFEQINDDDDDDDAIGVWENWLRH